MNPIDHIDEYMAGNMSPEDRAAFDEALKQDADLKRLVDNYDLVKKVSTGVMEMELLEEVESVANRATTARRISRWKLFGIAAVILALIALTIYYFNFRDRYHEEAPELIAIHYTPPKMQNAMRSGDLSKMPPFEAAQDYFSRNYYEESRDKLLQIIDEAKPGDYLDEVRYWLGCTYIELADYKKALRQFEQIEIRESECHEQLCLVILKKAERNTLDSMCKRK